MSFDMEEGEDAFVGYFSEQFPPEDVVPTGGRPPPEIAVQILSAGTQEVAVQFSDVMLDADGIPNGVATRDTTATFSPPTPAQLGYTADELRPYGYTE